MKRNLFFIALTMLIIIANLLLLSACGAKDYYVNFIDDDKVIHSEKIAQLNKLPSITDKHGYVFDGWYYDKENNNAFEIEHLTNYDIKEDITVYSKWTPIYYSITYNTMGGENSQENPSEYTIETPTITLADPTKANSVFEGWYSGNTLVTEIVKGTVGNIELTARWSDYNYIVEYDKEATELENGQKLAEIINNATEGSTIYVSAGEYLLDEVITIDKSLSIVGAGQDTTVLRMYDNIGTMFMSIGGQCKAVDFTLMRMQIDGYKKTTSNNNSALRIGSSSSPNEGGSFTVDQCRFTNFTKNNITVYGGNATITNNHIVVLQVEGSAGNGIQIDMGATAVITDNIITSAVSNAEQWLSGGIIVLRGGNVTNVSDNYIADCNIGICLETYYDAPEHNTMLDVNAEISNTFHNCNYDVFRREKN